MKFQISLLSLSLAAFAMFSCNSSHDADHETAHEADSLHAVQKDTAKITVADTTKFKFDFALANVPSPAVSMQELSKWNSGYDNSILNDVSKMSKYTTEFDRAINMGVYNIDMCYAMANDKGSDVLKYMKSVVQLTDAMGLKGAVNSMVGKRAENNLGNKDSLFMILDEIFVKSDDYLRTNERVFTAATIFTGGWIESLYITCQTGIKSSDAAVKSKVNNLLWEQRFHLGNIITMLNDHKTKKEAAQLIADLKPIHEEIQAVKQIAELDDAKFQSISGKITALRNKLTH